MTKQVSSLLAFALVAAAAGVAAIYAVRAHTPAAHKVAAENTVPKQDVQLTSMLQGSTDTRGITWVYATVDITNTTERPVPYIGFPCYDPATVSFRSTRPFPAGPAYGPSAASLRTHIMEFRRTRDEVGSFESADPTPSEGACDRSAIPELLPHQTIHHVQRAEIDLGDGFAIDAATTDIVTTVQLAAFSDPTQPTILQPTRQVEISSPLASVARTAGRSLADYDLTSGRFNAAMRDPVIGPWVAAQDPSSWGEVELEDAGPPDAWTLTAVNLAWATPLLVTGRGGIITRARIPHEKQLTPPTIAAALPADTTSLSPDYVPYNDYYAGDLVLPSGIVMIGDPVSSDNMLTFNYGLKPGHYPIHLITARPRYLGSDWERNAWETMLLTPNPVVRWEPAIPIGHTKAELKPGYVFEWGTDGGEGGMASPEVMKLEDASLTSDTGLYEDIAGREEANGWRYGIGTVDARNGANVFLCASGFGDGGYPVLLGLDARGKPAQLLSDFAVLGMTYSGIGA